LDVFPKHGIKLSLARSLLFTVFGEYNIKFKTTAEFCAQFLNPHLAKSNCSLCEWLKDNNLPAFHKKAQVFVSHAWTYQILDVLDALEYQFLAEPDVVIWFDVFCNKLREGSRSSCIIEGMYSDDEVCIRTKSPRYTYSYG
jgi:hypothetical protein